MELSSLIVTSMLPVTNYMTALWTFNHCHIDSLFYVQFEDYWLVMKTYFAQAMVFKKPAFIYEPGDTVNSSLTRILP